VRVIPQQLCNHRGGPPGNEYRLSAPYDQPHGCGLQILDHDVDWCAERASAPAGFPGFNEWNCRQAGPYGGDCRRRCDSGASAADSISGSGRVGNTRRLSSLVVLAGL
jgi:hypothetical protein